MANRRILLARPVRKPTHDSAHLPTTAPPATRAAASAAERGLVKRHWKMAVLLTILGIAGCSSLVGLIDPSTTGDTTPPAATSSEDPGAEPGAEASEPPTYQIGEKARDDSYQFVVTKVRCGVRRIGDAYSNGKAQGQFCLVNLKVKNVGKDPINFSDENQALIDTKGKQYSPDDAAWIYIDDAEIYAEINPSNTLKTTVPFDVAKKAKPDYLLLKAGVWGFSEGVRVKL
jgi:Domain of unknown function (DUF4352)